MKAIAAPYLIHHAHPGTFSNRFNRLLKSVVRQRSRLLNDDTSGISKSIAWPIVERLGRYVDYGFNDVGAARFLLNPNTQYEIRLLIPKNKSGNTRMIQLDTLIAAAKVLTQNIPNYVY